MLGSGVQGVEEQMVWVLFLRSISLPRYLANQGRSPRGNYYQDDS